MSATAKRAERRQGKRKDFEDALTILLDLAEENTGAASVVLYRAAKYLGFPEDYKRNAMWHARGSWHNSSVDELKIFEEGVLNDKQMS